MADAADTKTQSRKRNAQAASKQARDASLRSLLLTVLGRKYLWDELASARVFEQTVDFDSHARMCFAEGQRAVGLALLASIMSIDPNSFIVMMRENSPVKLDDQEESDD